MHTRAVYRIAQALTSCRIATLRFNFRGVGTSTGSFDDGVGELEDARAAIAWLGARFPDSNLVVGGFSFGAVIGLRAGVETERASLLLGAGVPVGERRYDLSFLFESDKPLVVVQGENDEFGDPAQVAEALSPLGSSLALYEIQNADHLFAGKTEELVATIREQFRSPAVRRLLEDRLPPRRERK